MEVMFYRAWNTGRPYTTFGQRIGYAVMTDNTIIFNDVDRGITGYVNSEFMPVDDYQARVRQAYLDGRGELYWSYPTGMPVEVFFHIANKAGEYAVKHAGSVSTGGN